MAVRLLVGKTPKSPQRERETGADAAIQDSNAQIEEVTMKKPVLSLSLPVAFLVGCLTAVFATKIVLPTAKATTNPQKSGFFAFSNAVVT